MHRLFVYGTLKKGKGNHDRILSGYDIKITPAWTYGKLYDLGGYPAITQGNNKVYGELIEFANHEILRKIDYLEGFKGANNPNNFYKRQEVQVFVVGDEVSAWAYFLTKEKIVDFSGKLIKSGNWMNSS